MKLHKIARKNPVFGFEQTFHCFAVNGIIRWSKHCFERKSTKKFGQACFVDQLSE